MFPWLLSLVNIDRLSDHHAAMVDPRDGLASLENNASMVVHFSVSEPRLSLSPLANEIGQLYSREILFSPTFAEAAHSWWSPMLVERLHLLGAKGNAGVSMMPR